MLIKCSFHCTFLNPLPSPPVLFLLCLPSVTPISLSFSCSALFLSLVVSRLVWSVERTNAWISCSPELWGELSLQMFIRGDSPCWQVRPVLLFEGWLCSVMLAEGESQEFTFIQIRQLNQLKNACPLLWARILLRTKFCLCKSENDFLLFSSDLVGSGG